MILISNKHLNVEERSYFEWNILNLNKTPYIREVSATYQHHNGLFVTPWMNSKSCTRHSVANITKWIVPISLECQNWKGMAPHITWEEWKFTCKRCKICQEACTYMNVSTIASIWLFFSSWTSTWMFFLMNQHQVPQPHLLLHQQHTIRTSSIIISLLPFVSVIVSPKHRRSNPQASLPPTQYHVSSSCTKFAHKTSKCTHQLCLLISQTPSPLSCASYLATHLNPLSCLINIVHLIWVCRYPSCSCTPLHVQLSNHTILLISTNAKENY